MRRQKRHTSWRSQSASSQKITRQSQAIKAELDQAKAASDESVPLSEWIRAGQNQIAMHERDLKAARKRVDEAERNTVAAQNRLEQHRAKVQEVEKGKIYFLHICFFSHFFIFSFF